ncbi:MAG: Na-translocating system protein MpsB [Sulfurimonas sp.]|nr:Na-translocating system protein MpsB [Sulfurimonas sp.]
MIVKEKDILHIDSLVESAIERIPNFWPIKSFIARNPLHGFENMHFEDAVNKAHTLFHSNKSLPREEYQRFYQEGKIADRYLGEEIEHFLSRQESAHPLMEKILLALMRDSKECYHYDALTEYNSTIKNMAKKLDEGAIESPEEFSANLVKQIAKEKSIYEVVDTLFASDIQESLNDIMSQIAMRYLGEGQAVWNMPKRSKGMFLSWKEIVMQDKIFFDESQTLCRLLRETKLAEDIIFLVLKELKIPRSFWEEYFTLELTKLLGWSGFLKYRSKSSSEFHKKYPAYMEEFLAIRLYYSYMLLKKCENTLGFFPSMKELASYIMNHKEEVYLRHEYHSGKLLMNYYERVEAFLQAKRKENAKEIYDRYVYDKKIHDYNRVASYLHTTLSLVSDESQIEMLETQELNTINTILENFSTQEGFIWLKAMEKTTMMQLMQEYVTSKEPQKEKIAAFDAQLFFCIDTRSERIRRHIEAQGAYETFGMAGFFGIPFKSIDVSNKCELDLCPAIVTPKHIVYSFHEKESIKGTSKNTF